MHCTRFCGKIQMNTILTLDTKNFDTKISSLTTAVVSSMDFTACMSCPTPTTIFLKSDDICGNRNNF